MTPPDLLTGIVHIFRDFFPPLSQQITPSENFVVPGISNLVDGCHNFPPGSAAFIDLGFEFLACFYDSFHGSGQCLTVTLPAGHPGKQGSDTARIRLHLLQFIGQNFHFPPGI